MSNQDSQNSAVTVHNQKLMEELAVKPFTDEDLADVKFQFETSTGCDW